MKHSGIFVSAALMLLAVPVFAAEQQILPLRDWLLAKPDAALTDPAAADRNHCRTV